MFTIGQCWGCMHLLGWPKEDIPLSFSPIGTETMLSSAFPLGWLQEHLESNCLGLYTCHCVSCNIIPLALTVSCPSFISHLSYISKPPQAGNEIFYPKFLFEHFHLSNLISERIRNFQKLVLILNIPFSELYHCSLKLKTHHLPLFNFPFPWVHSATKYYWVSFEVLPVFFPFPS